MRTNFDWTPRTKPELALMADDEDQHESDEDGEATDTETQAQTWASRRDLRPRVTLRDQEISHQPSLLYQTMNRGRLGAQSDELRARVQKTLADAERILTSPRISMANALEDRRERSRIVNAVDSSDELDFYPDPPPLFVGGHDPHAGRLGPKTKECDNASEAGESRIVTGQVKAAGLNRDEFHKK